MQPWETRSDHRQQTMLSLGSLAIGALLVIGLHDAGASGSTGQAGFLLGVILLALGLATGAAGGRQTVRIDASAREIRIDDRGLTGTRSRTIGFGDIRTVQLACLQTRTRHALRYFLQLDLASGEQYALFSPERSYPAAVDPAVVGGWKTRLEALLQAGSDADPSHQAH